MHMKRLKVTPKKAAEWLTRNTNNRPSSIMFANRIAEAMLATAA